MKRALTGLMVAAVAATGALGGMDAGGSSGGTLQTFADGGATVTISGGTVTITLTTSVNTEDGGVFLKSKSQGGKLLNQVAFSFNSTGAVAGGAPRFSIPINTNGTGSISGYAFLDVLGCGYSTGQVSTGLANCHVNFQSVDYANWATFAAVNPTYRTAPGAIPFIIADGTCADPTCTYVVDSIVLR
jgi:hypothetical protein